MTVAKTWGNKLSPKTSDEPFRYKDLDDPRHIRLLRISHSFGILSGKFLHVPLDNLPIEYEAVSYCWGDPSPVDRIWFGDHSYIDITASASAILRYVADAKKGGWIWIDALCIDQKNDKEKGHQVRLMRDIYPSATRVIAYLGLPSADSDLAMEFLETLSNAIETKFPDPHSAEFSWTQTRTILNSFSIEQWRAIKNLLDRNWFNRLWIVQEMVLASKTTFVCGSVQLSWKPCLKTMGFLYDSNLHGEFLTIREDGKMSRIPLGFNNLQVTSIYRSISREKEPILLRDLLQSLSTFEATDARDKIFALIGIATDSEDKAMDPDYEASTEEVFTNVSRYLITRDQSSILLHSAGVGFDRTQVNLPSWVADWTSEFWKSGVRTLQLFDQGWKAAGTSKVKVRAGNDPRSLMVMGRRIDAVKSVFSKMPSRHLNATNWQTEKAVYSRVTEWFDGSARFFEALKPYPTGEVWDDVHWRTLTVDNTSQRKRATSEDAADFELYLSCIQFYASCNSWDEADVGPEEATVEGFYRIADAFEQHQRRALFSTAQGYAGMGPPGILKDDMVCLFDGAITPFIVRPNLKTDGEATIYTLVGECYIHGLMYGEGMRLGVEEQIVLD
jgi:hypothetical protein